MLRGVGRKRRGLLLDAIGRHPQLLNPDSAVASWRDTGGARSWRREDTQACSLKVLSRIWQSAAALARIFRIALAIASCLEAVKYCLHDGRIAPRGANHFQLRNSGSIAHSPARGSGFTFLRQGITGASAAGSVLDENAVINEVEDVT